MVVTKGVKWAKRLRAKTPRFAHNLALDKRKAHRKYRRAAKIAVRLEKDVNEVPLLTEREII